MSESQDGRVFNADHPMIHASDTTKHEFCPREWYLRYKYDQQSPPFHIHTSMKWTFDFGWWGQDYISKYLHEQLWGSFSKDNMKAHCSFGTDYPAEKGWVYEEPRFVHPSLPLSGGVDIVLKGNSQPYPNIDGRLLVEVKTIKADTFKTLKVPLQEHVQRTNLYLDLVRHWAAAKDNLDEWHLEHAVIIYACKGFGNKSNPSRANGETFSPFKEFVIKYDPSLTQAIWDGLREVQDTVVAGSTSVPPKRICGSKAQARAQACCVNGVCFKQSL